LATNIKLIKLIALLLTLSTNAFANKVFVCSPYKSGPFVIDESKRLGLIYTYTDFLNRQAQGKYSFEVLILPRSRLLIELASNTQCIVPFVSHQWFDPDKQLYYWSQPLMNDANVILSSPSKRLESIVKEQVAGLRTSQVIGFVDEQLEVLIADNILTAFNSLSLEQSIMMLAYERIDFVVSGKIPLLYLINKLQLQDKVYISKNQTVSFDRSVLVQKSNPQLSTFIETQTNQLKMSVQWKETLVQLGIDG
jgi:polar amino acid transport system substrate-binding protein